MSPVKQLGVGASPLGLPIPATEGAPPPAERLGGGGRSTAAWEELGDGGRGWARDRGREVLALGREGEKHEHWLEENAKVSSVVRRCSGVR